MVESEDNTAQRLAVRRANEATKLSATLLNNLAVGIFIAGLLAPSMAGRSLSIIWYVALICVAIGLHLAGRMLLRGLDSEE